MRQTMLSAMLNYVYIFKIAASCCNFTMILQQIAANHQNFKKSGKQGRIHGNPVADSWAGAVMRKPITIQKCYGGTDRPTDRPTWQVVESRVRD